MYYVIMVGFSVPVKLLLSLVLGAVIGLERESYEKKIDKSPISGVGSLGVRSFSLITTLGAVAGILYTSHYSLYLLISITFMILLLAYYITGSFFTRDNGITTELAIFFSFLIGIFISLEVFPIQLVIAMVIILVGIMTIKEKLHVLVSDINSKEFSAFLSYAIIALVILPFLPNKTFNLSDIPNLGFYLSNFNINLNSVISLPLFNPFNIWRVVVIITGVDLFGYLLSKIMGQNKGWIITSLVGGFVSSTSTTQSLAQQSKTSGNTNKLVSAALFANLASFFQHFLLIATVNSIFLVKSIYYVGAIILSALILAIYFLTLKSSKEIIIQDSDKEKSLKEGNIFALGPALKFALLFLLVTVITKISLVLFGDQGFLVTTALASITGLDATTINISQLVGSNITYQIGLFSLVVANAVNLIAKTVYGFAQGKKEFAIKFALSVAIIILCSLVGILPLI